MTTSLDETGVRPRRVFPWAAMIGGSAIAVAIGLLAAQSFFYAQTAPKADADANLSQPNAAPELVDVRFVPSDVIETNPKFFFGSGDGSNGYYSERPNHPERPIER